MLLSSAALALTLQSLAFAHPERLSGLVLSVLDERHEVVVRCDAAGAKPSQTTLFRLPQNVDPTSVHAGDRIVALAEAHEKGTPILDQVKILPAEQPKSAIRTVVPLLVGDTLPATKFIDQGGREFSLQDFHGDSVVLSFIYTRCKDQYECPLISSHFGVLQKRFAGGPYHLVEVTLDPSYDRPQVLASYGRCFGADPSRWTFATGDPETVLDFAARFGIDPFADPQKGLIHTERTVLIDPNGKILDFIDLASWDPNAIVARFSPMQTNPDSLLGRLDFWLSKATVAICGNGATGFNGLEDLAIILAILGAVAFVLQRVARFFLTH